MSSEESQSGGPASDDMTEPKEKPKVVRVLTVVAYTLSVSMAAILLSIYYVFMWDGHPTLARKGPVSSPMRMDDHEGFLPNRTRPMQDTGGKKFQSGGGDVFMGMLRFGRFEKNEDNKKTKDKLEPYPYEPTAIPVMEALTTQPPTDSSTETAVEEEDDEWPKYSSNFTEKLVKMSKRSLLFHKLIKTWVN